MLNQIKLTCYNQNGKNITSTIRNVHTIFRRNNKILNSSTVKRVIKKFKDAALVTDGKYKSEAHRGY